MKKGYLLLITIVIELVFVFLFMLVKGIFNQNIISNVYKIIIDSFFAVGVVSLCSGLLIFSSNKGTFDILVYGVGKFAKLFKRNQKDLYKETFFDYRSNKNKSYPFSNLIVSGVCLISVSLTFLIIYYK